MNKGIKLLNETIVSSSTTSVTFSGLTEDAVYFFHANNIVCVTDEAYMKLFVTSSGSQVTSSNYDNHYLRTRSDSTSAIGSGRDDQDGWALTEVGLWNDSSMAGCYQGYIFNLTNATKYSMLASEAVVGYYQNWTFGNWTNGYYNVSQVHDGISFQFNNGNIASGEFRIFQLTS
jgi:hypothetical protein